MQPISRTYSATGAQVPISLDWRIAQFNVSYAVVVPGGVTASVTLDTTLDDVNDPSVTPVWIASTAITETTLGNLTAPVQWARLTIGSISGGDVTLKILQGESVD